MCELDYKVNSTLTVTQKNTSDKKIRHKIQKCVCFLLLFEQISDDDDDDDEMARFSIA